MSKSIETIVEDIYSILEPHNIADIPDELYEDFGKRMADMMKRRLTEEAYDRKGLLRMSQIGRSDLQIYNDFNGVDREELLPSTRLKFLYGDMVEELVLFLAKATGHKVEKEQHEFNIDGVTGHLDAEIDGEAVDVKSASPFSFKKFKDLKIFTDDPFGYIAQLSSYIHCLGKKRGFFLVIDKVNGTLLLTKVPKSKLIDVVARIKHLKEVVASKVPPAPTCKQLKEKPNGNIALGISCAYCAYKKSCFPKLRTFIYAHGPEYLETVLEGKEPRVFEDKE